MAFIYGEMTFANNARRNQVRTRIVDEAAARGFVAAQLERFGPIESVSIGGAPGLRFCYSGPFPVADQAHADLYAYADQNGSVDGFFGTLNND